ncbi:MAG: hypothetical protein BAJATHORv1_30066 [Candidatus Thorarchaeota archaeon]|nr:MAG: hypothetical protein BAJATHORv1_30066 [Candidatus Thorarchaeota archaeon]
MLPEKVIESVNEIVSGIRAKDNVDKISGYHRIQVTSEIDQAIDWVKENIDGLDNVETRIFEYQSDGKTSIETWDSLYSWSPDSAMLKLLEPEEKILADFGAEKISLAAHSTTADCEAEVVFVGKGEEDADYESKDIKGKVVLTTGKAKTVHKRACIDREALGVLTYIPPSGKNELAAIRRYEGLWPNLGEAEKTKFGFALTQADGIKIKTWLDDGKTVKVRAQVKAELGTGKQRILSGYIKGKDDSKEIWAFAHICHPHPGANDNASGAGALVESIRAINYLINEGIIQQPEYSIRFLWGAEWHSTIHLIDQETDLLEKCVAMINMDMVGANPALSGSVMKLYRTPFSLPSSLNNIVRYWMEHEGKKLPKAANGGSITPHVYRYSRYGAGSDHFLFTDATVGIPAVMLNQFPDKFYHTSTDTIDKIDPSQMAYSTRVLSLSLLSMALRKTMCKEVLLTTIRNEMVELLQEISMNAISKLGQCIGDPEDIYAMAFTFLGYVRNLGFATLEKAKTEWYLISEQEQLRQSLKTSIEMSYTAEMVVLRRAYEGACAEVGLEAKEEGLIDLDKVSFELEVKRTFKYALSPSKVFEVVGDEASYYIEKRMKDEHYFDRIDELMNLSVEWANLDNIWKHLAFQFGYFEQKELSKIVRDLEAGGLLETRSTS